MGKKSVILYASFLFILGVVMVGVHADAELIELNISDGSTTYVNGTDTTNYYFSNADIITLRGTVSNGTDHTDDEGLVDSGWLYCDPAASTALTNSQTQPLTLSVNSATGAAYFSVAIPSACLVDGNTTTFSLAVNLTNGTTSSNYTQFNTSFGAPTAPYAFNVSSTINSRIGVVNVSYTFTDSEGSSTTRVLSNTDSGLTTGYVGAKNVTIDIEVGGWQRSNNTVIVYNNSGGTVVYLYNGIFDSATVNSTLGAVLITPDVGFSTDASVRAIFETSLDFTSSADNDSLEFYVVTNNTEIANYTHVLGPYRFQVDKTAPSVSFTPPSDLTINPKDSITYECEGSDSGAGVYKYKWKLTKPDSDTVSEDFSTSNEVTFTGDETNVFGEYIVECTVLDYAGNEKSLTTSSTQTFKVISSISYASGDGGDTTTGSTFDMDLSTSESGEVKALQGAVKKFSLDGTTEHTMTFTEVTATTATLEFASTPVSVTLIVGETKEVDLDGDGTNDISANLVSVINSKADVIVRKAQASVAPVVTPPVVTPTAEQPPTGEVVPPAEVEGGSSAWLWIVIIVVLAVVVVGYFLLKKRK